jgi:hypothetical protein
MLQGIRPFSGSTSKAMRWPHAQEILRFIVGDDRD